MCVCCTRDADEHTHTSRPAAETTHYMSLGAFVFLMMQHLIHRGAHAAAARNSVVHLQRTLVTAQQHASGCDHLHMLDQSCFRLLHQRAVQAMDVRSLLLYWEHHFAHLTDLPKQLDTRPQQLPTQQGKQAVCMVTDSQFTCGLW